MKSSLALVRHHVLPAALCIGLAWLLSTFDWMERVENLTLDVRTRLRADVRRAGPPEDLVIIGIDEASLSDFGRWPWPRDFHGDLLKLFGRVMPSVVGWDILFTEGTPEDELFAAGIEASGATVVLGAMRVEADEGILPGHQTLAKAKLAPLLRVVGDRSRILTSPALLVAAGRLREVAEAGFVDTPPASDGVRRVAPLVVRVGENVYPTLSLQCLMQHWQVGPMDVEVRLGDAVIFQNAGIRRRIPIDETGGYRINYRYAMEGLENSGYSQLYGYLQKRFDPKQANGRPKRAATVSDQQPPDLTGKIVLVGQSADALSDNGPTPFSPLTPLVLVHANVVANVLAEDYVRRVPPVVTWLGAFAAGVAGLVQFSKRKLLDQAVFSFGVPVAYVALATGAWIQGSWHFPLAGPLVGFAAIQVFMITRRVLEEQRAKEQIKGMFGTYVSPEVVKRMVDSGEQPRLGGHEAEITAYFSDIQNFSTFSEQLQPERVVELMNEYLTACTDIVQEEGGTLDKYIGDAIVAMFGAPVSVPEHAFHACVATQRVHARLAELRTKWQGEGHKWPAIVWRMQTRIGLNTGRCIIGNMGSRTRFNYTMMGDDVNLAARMESGAKAWGAYSMCTDATRLACEKHGGDRVVFRPLGRIIVKGRSRPVPIHEIVGLKESITDSSRECIAVFSAGLERYWMQDWEGALASFQRSLALEPNVPGKTPGVKSNPSLVYIDLVREYQASPPAADWDGVYVMKEK